MSTVQVRHLRISVTNAADQKLWKNQQSARRKPKEMRILVKGGIKEDETQEDT